MTDEELTRYATHFRNAILRGGPSAWMCAAISAPLCAALATFGVQSRLLESDLGDCNHVFLQLTDGRVLDPTADQFNWCSPAPLPPVYLGLPETIHQSACPYHGQCWNELLREFKRLVPALDADAVGGMVRMALATLPAGMLLAPPTSV